MKTKLLFTLLISATMYSQETVNSGLQRYLKEIKAETANIPNQLPIKGINALFITARKKLGETETYQDYKLFLTKAPRVLQEVKKEENPHDSHDPEINVIIDCFFNLFGEINSHLPQTNEPFQGTEKDTILKIFKVHELKVISQALAQIPE